MNASEINELVTLTEKLEKLLEEYGAVTDGLMSCETEDTASINSFIAKRGECIDRMKPVKDRISAVISAQPEQTASMLRELYSGGQSDYTSPELGALQKAAVNFRSAQAAAAVKEQTLEKQFNSRYNDLRDMLVKLREDKRKIDFYSSIQAKQLGSTLDSRS